MNWALNIRNRSASYLKQRPTYRRWNSGIRLAEKIGRSIQLNKFHCYHIGRSSGTGYFKNQCRNMIYFVTPGYEARSPINPACKAEGID